MAEKRRDLDYIARRDEDPLSTDALFGIDKSDELRDHFRYKAVPGKDLEDLKLPHKTAAVPRAQLERYARELQEDVDSSLGIRMRRFIARVQAAMKLGVTPQELSDMFYGGAPLPDPLRIAGLGYETEARYLHAQPVQPKDEEPAGGIPEEQTTPKPDDNVTASMPQWRQFVDTVRADPRLRRAFGLQAKQISQDSAYRHLDEAQRTVLASTVISLAHPLQAFTLQKKGQLITETEEAAMERIAFGLNRITSILSSARPPATMAVQQDRLADPEWLDKMAIDLDPQNNLTGAQPNSPLAAGDDVTDHLGNSGKVTSANPDGSFDVEYDANGSGVKKTTYDSNAFTNGLVKRSVVINDEDLFV